ncbi:MAG: hypothetical protein ABFR35_09570 [Thermodesulfobacteriota bacterium]
MKNNLHLNKIDSDKFAEKILSLLNSNKPKDFLFADIVTIVQKETGIESIGLRLQDGFDYPYYVTRGFSQDFVEMENFLCVLDNNGKPVRGPQGLPKLECMCGNIIRGRVNSSLPHFTRGGSFWTNSTTDFIAEASIIDQQEESRNRCNREGYESVALIPVKDTETYGLLQLNDSRKNLYTLKFIELMEWVAASISILISYLRQQENSQSIKDALGKYQPSRIFGPIKSRE